MDDPIPQFEYFISQLAKLHSNLAYIHLIEPRISAADDPEPVSDDESNDFVRALWSPRPLIHAGGFIRETALREAAMGDKNVLIAMGRYYISNPDLPRRWMNETKLTPYDRSTFYTKGAKGYTDWVFSQEVKL